MKIRGMDFVMCQVSDLARAAKFYRENHPNVKPGPNLPGELLTALAGLTNVAALVAPATSADAVVSFEQIRILFLDAKLASRAP